jgi:hypothetical protein
MIWGKKEEEDSNEYSLCPYCTIKSVVSTTRLSVKEKEKRMKKNADFIDGARQSLVISELIKSKEICWNCLCYLPKS